MTKKEVFTKAMNMFEVGSEEYAVMEKAIAQLNKRSDKPTKAQIANQAIKADIAEYLENAPDGATARQIADDLGLSVNKVAALVKDIKGIVKVPGKKSKDAPIYMTAPTE